MTTLAQGRTVEQWADELNEQWQRLVDNTVAGFMELGRRLNEAKAELGKHGQWMELVKQLKFHQRIANRFMHITNWADEVGRIASNLQELLPPDYTTIDQLASLPHPKLLELIENGTINPSIKRNEVSKILRLERVKADEQRVLSLRPRPGKYKTLVIDPAWEYDWLSIAGRAKPGYGMQSHEQLRALNLKQWAEPECQLWCWTTNNFNYEANKLIEHWGFQHRTILTWIKPPPFGLGSYLRNSTEHCIFATLGDTTTRPAAASIPTHFFAPRGEHSEKPEEFYEIVRQASYPPYGEGNQRKMRPDFTDLFMSGDALVAAE